MEGLEFEAVDKKIEADKATEAAATADAESNVPKAEDDSIVA